LTAAKTASTPRRALKQTGSSNFDYNFVGSGFFGSAAGAGTGEFTKDPNGAATGVFGGFFALSPRNGNGNGGNPIDYNNLFVKNGNSYSKFLILIFNK
jgi:hypothetical protein